MITIGVDAHKSMHAAVALDDAGRELAVWHGPNSPAGWAALAAWAAAHAAAERVWGIEGAGNYGRGLAQHLLTAGETVYDINPRWTAGARRQARRPGKSDRLDARAVALVVRREAATLSPLQAEDETAVLDLLVTEREGALAEATRLRNQLHALLLQLDPQYKEALPPLDTEAGVAALVAYQGPRRTPTPLQREQAASVRRLAQRLRLATEQASELKRQIEARAEAGFSPLIRLKGISARAGILGPGRRFSGEAQLAAYAGVAPLEASSAGRVRHRLNRGGNRRLNAILYRIALTQVRCWPPAQAYVARRLSEGKTKREAIRALKRYLIRAIWRLWHECLSHQRPSSVSHAA